MKTIKKIFKSIGAMFSSLFTRKKPLDDLTEAIENNEVIVSPSKQIADNFFRNKLGVIGLVGFILIFVIVFGISAFVPYNEYNFETTLQNLPPGKGYLNVDKNLNGENLVQIESGVSFSVGLDTEGKLYFWGKNPPQFNVSEILELTKDEKVVAIAAGDTHILALTEGGDLIGAGNNDFEQASAEFGLTSQMAGRTIVKMDAGTRLSAVLLDNNRIYVWGATLPNDLDTIPSSVQGHVVDIAVSPYNVVLLLDDGTVRTIGRQGSSVATIPPHLTDGSINLVQITVANNTAAALDDTGKVHLWGDQSANMRIADDAPTNITFIASGRSSLYALTEDKQIYAWGLNKFDIVSGANKNTKNVETIFSDYFQTYAVTEDGRISAWGNDGYLLGTDDLGRDLAERLIQGGRVSLVVGAVAVIISAVIGVIIGLIAGFNGGLIDNVLMRIAEVFSSFPFLPLAITLSVMLPPDTSQQFKLIMIMVIMGLLSWPGVARLVRGQILAEREKDFVLAARALGLRESTIIIKHILPSVANLIIVNMTLSYAGSLLTEAGLSFLGFGVVPPTPSWGNMLSGITGTTTIEFYWWRWLFPALCVLFTALSVNLIGDAMRDAVDPRSNEK